MTPPTCKTCPYWERLTATGEGDTGQCQRHPPQVVGCLAGGGGVFNRLHTETFFPETFDDDWCGEHPDTAEYIASQKAAP